MRKNLLVTVAFVLAALTGLWAQGVTTGSIRGTVKDQKGESLPGANVVAIHVPSGTLYGTSTRPDGVFTIPNARIGGPYKLTTSLLDMKIRKKTKFS